MDPLTTTTPLPIPLPTPQPIPSKSPFPRTTIMIGLLVLIILGLSAYLAYDKFLVSKTPPAISSPSPITTLPSPSITPSPTIYIKNQTYTDPTYGYSFYLPGNWVVTQNKNIYESRLIPGEKITSTQVVQDDTKLEIFYEGEFDHGWPELIPKEETIKLDGKSGEKLTFSVEGNRKLILIYKISPNNPNSAGFRIEIDTPTSKVNLVDQILSTFRFTEKSNSTPSSTPPSQYSCPPTGIINCMPILDDERAKACSKEAISWYKQNCPNFQEVAY